MGEIKTQLNDLQKDVTSLKIDMATVKTELSAVGVELGTVRDDVKDVKGRGNAEIWALIIAVIGAVITAFVRLGIFLNA
ncbi:hypothetical protein [Synechocystis salina]|uniref:hypothetical protein n=1 Tax=Synechocystis salina TaxID=945780 RepID=UPI001D14441A|nr:hypothetical protein [Synechocystis salina]